MRAGVWVAPTPDGADDMTSASSMIRAVLVAAACLSLSSCSASEQTLTKVDPLNEVMYQHFDEVRQHYGKLGIRPLVEISENSYARFRKYVANDAVYVVVHPAYYVFFQDTNCNKVYIGRSEDFSRNIVDMFLDDYPTGGSPLLEQMKLNLKNERDFIAEKSRNNQLVILVLPPRYLKHPEYPYKKLDEFRRYLNDVANDSPSILYVESENHKSGYLSSEVLDKVARFLKANGVKRVFVAGGYEKLCLQNLYDQMAGIQTIEKISFMGGLCTASPDSLQQCVTKQHARREERDSRRELQLPAAAAGSGDRRVASSGWLRREEGELR